MLYSLRQIYIAVHRFDFLLHALDNVSRANLTMYAWLIHVQQDAEFGFRSCSVDMFIPLSYLFTHMVHMNIWRCVGVGGGEEA